MVRGNETDEVGESRGSLYGLYRRCPEMQRQGTQPLRKRLVRQSLSLRIGTGITEDRRRDRKT